MLSLEHFSMPLKSKKEKIKKKKKTWQAQTIGATNKKVYITMNFLKLDLT